MINDAQFVFSKQSYIKLGWKNIKLQSGYVLNWQEKLKVLINDEHTIALLGEVWQVASNQLSPQELDSEKFSIKK